MGGWQGKVLRIDLSAGTSKEEPLNQEWADQYLGQRGLATKYLYEEMDPAVDSLSPDNKMIFATGPLTGTMASTGGRWSVVTKGALTDAIACSNSGGYFGGELKLSGWDMVIFEGKSPHPVYVMIRDDDVQILDARDFIWGETAWEAEDRIRTRHQDPLIRVATIGRAGEAMVRFACVMNDKDRAAGRSGVGAVMGSKNLKAVGVRGTVGVRVHDPAAFMKIVSEMRQKLDTHAARNRLNAVGTHAMMDNTNAYGSLPTRNGRDVQFESAREVQRRRSDIRVTSAREPAKHCVRRCQQQRIVTWIQQAAEHGEQGILGTPGTHNLRWRDGCPKLVRLDSSNSVRQWSDTAGNGVVGITFS